jgi:hypothetical protein
VIRGFGLPLAAAMTAAFALVRSGLLFALRDQLGLAVVDRAAVPWCEWTAIKPSPTIFGVSCFLTS